MSATARQRTVDLSLALAGAAGGTAAFFLLGRGAPRFPSTLAGHLLGPDTPVSKISFCTAAMRSIRSPNLLASAWSVSRKTPRNELSSSTVPYVSMRSESFGTFCPEASMVWPLSPTFV